MNVIQNLLLKEVSREVHKNRCLNNLQQRGRIHFPFVNPRFQWHAELTPKCHLRIRWRDPCSLVFWCAKRDPAHGLAACTSSSLLPGNRASAATDKQPLSCRACSFGDEHWTKDKVRLTRQATRPRSVPIVACCVVSAPKMFRVKSRCC